MADLNPIIEFAAELSNQSAEEVAETLKTDDGEGFDPAKVASFLKTQTEERVKANKTETFDTAYKKAKREESERVEKLWRDKLGIETDLKGEELIDYSVEQLQKKYSTAQKIEPTEKDILNHSLFKKTVSELQTEKQQLEQQLANQAKEWERNQKFSGVKEKAFALLDSKNPLDVPQKATWYNTVANELKQYDWQEQDGNLIAFDSEGNQVKNNLGHAVSFEDLVMKSAQNVVVFQESTPKKSNPGKTEDGKPAFPRPSSEAEYLEMIGQNSTLSPEQRKALYLAKTDADNKGEDFFKS